MFRMFRKLWLGIPPLLTSSFFADEEVDHYEEEFNTKVSKIFLTTLQSEYENLKVFAVNTDVLGREIASHLDIRLGRMTCNRFADGQVNIEILDSIRGHRVYLLKTFQPKGINDGLVELLLTIACMKKQGAESVTAIIPFFPYTIPSGNEIKEGRDFYTSFGSDVVKMLEAVGCDGVVCLNSSMSSPKGFAQASTLLDLNASELVVPQMIRAQPERLVVIGSKSDRMHINSVHHLKKAFQMFQYTCGLGFFDHADYIGDQVEGRDVLLFTNTLRSKEAIVRQSLQLKKQGARKVYCFGFHGICSIEEVSQLMEESGLKELILTNSVSYKEDKKIRTISIAKMLAEIITILQEEKSLKEYRHERETTHYFYLQKMQMLNRMKMEQDKNIRADGSGQ